jgi:hypothetical protein
MSKKMSAETSPGVKINYSKKLSAFSSFIHLFLMLLIIIKFIKLALLITQKITIDCFRDKEKKDETDTFGVELQVNSTPARSFASKLPN